MLGILHTNAQQVRKTAYGMEVTTKEGTARKVRLEVFGDRLIHVSATPDNKFHDRQSLAVLPHKKVQIKGSHASARLDRNANLNTSSQFHFKVKNSNGKAILSTPQIRAEVNTLDGNVTFYDRKGNLILAEDERQFTPFIADGKTEYSVLQSFKNSHNDEGLYGLGQHQSDEFNYKGKNEELFQYNTKVSVPFVVSNKNYGILWDSYSLCRFGNPNDYSQLGEVFRLYDKEGKEGALTGTYTSNFRGQKRELVRREDSLYFEHLDRNDHLSTVVNLPKGFPFAGSTVVYEGEIEPLTDADYRFILYYAGYIKVYVDDRLEVAERWRTAWNPNAFKFNIPLQAGKRVPIRIEWQPNGSVSYCGLRVMKPRTDEEQQQLTWWSEMQPQEDYYFVYGKNMDEVISGYRTLTGKSQIMPRWAMGFWQSRERYKTQDEIVGTLREFRQRHIPIDNIVQDWSYWPEESWGSHEFDASRFPNPKGMVDSIHAMNGRIMISVWPKFYTTTEHYKQFDQHGWMYRQAVRDSIRDWIGPGYLGSFYDAYSASARKMFWQGLKDHLMPLGIDAWWMDASEPNIRDCTDMQYRKDLCGPTALGPSAEYFNAYALMNAEAIYNGERSLASKKTANTSANANRRVFLLTRSGFAGLQRYSTATWSGDIGTRWEDMKSQINAGLNFSMSGIPYWTMDIGGFCVEDRYVAAQQLFDRTHQENADLKEWRELNARWYQFGAFCPLYRAHGQYPLREPWNIAPTDHPAYKSIVYYTQLRYHLMPYIYSLASKTWFDDYTIMRPLVMDYPNDRELLAIGDQYMFGPSLMVAPVTQYGATSREIYLPKALWYDFYSGTSIQSEGQRYNVQAPYERIPLLVPAGSIIPVGPAMEWSDQLPADTIRLYVYKGKSGNFTIYEDENVNYNYEQGRYAKIPISYNERSNTLTIGKRQGYYPGMIHTRKFVIVPVSPANPIGYNPEQEGKTITYTGKIIKVKI
ncbi:MAG: DUF5110 domain-containing protein [Bacteroidaceae bacterium]|nr:DUF5110 domain-containing protein [Bacteroidaceae bacterium]